MKEKIRYCKICGKTYVSSINDFKEICQKCDKKTIELSSTELISLKDLIENEYLKLVDGKESNGHWDAWEHSREIVSISYWNNIKSIREKITGLSN